MEENSHEKVRLIKIERPNERDIQYVILFNVHVGIKKNDAST